MAEYKAFKGIYEPNPEFLKTVPFDSPGEPYAGFFTGSPDVASRFAGADLTPEEMGDIIRSFGYTSAIVTLRQDTTAERSFCRAPHAMRPLVPLPFPPPIPRDE